MVLHGTGMEPAMLSGLFNLLQERSPVLMMVWALMENVLHSEFLDDLFARSALKQYTRTLLSSDVFIMMGGVLTGSVASVRERLVSLTSHYNKA
jgi:hypothetical protein